MSQPHVYRKADSFAALSGASDGAAAMRERVRGMALPADPYRRDVVGRARRALLGEAGADEPAFALRPFIVTEMERVSDADLPRYLFYRYRYDVFPAHRLLDAYPPCVQIEATSVCNYRCTFCYHSDAEFNKAGGGHMGHMALDLFKRLVDELHGNVEAVTLASRGEPLLCRDIEAMLEYLAGKFLGLKLNTNAWFLDERKAHAILAADPNTLVFSVDAADPELYARLRVNGRLDRVMDNIRRFAEIRAKHYPNSRVITRVSGVRCSDEQDFAAIEATWRDLVDQVAFVDMHPFEDIWGRPANGVTAHCSDLWRRPFVWWDGRVNPCEVDYRSALSTGSVADRSLSAVWTGEAYQALRAAHAEGRRQCQEPCKGCVMT